MSLISTFKKIFTKKEEKQMKTFYLSSVHCVKVHLTTKWLNKQKAF